MQRSTFKILFFFLVITNITKLSLGQNATIDSLLTILKKDIGDTNKVTHLYKLCWEYRGVGSYDSALFYGNAALILSKQLNFSRGIARSYNNIGLVYDERGDYDKALENHFASLKTSEEIGDKLCIASSYVNIGIIYDEQGNYDKALENYFTGLKISEETGNKKQITASYNNIGNNYSEHGNYALALENYLKAFKLYIEVGNKYGMALSYNNFGVIYYMEGNYRLALENHFKSLKIRKEIGDKQGISSSNNNIGIVYRKLKQPAKTVEYCNKGLNIAKEIGSKDDVMECYQNLSETYSDMSDYKNAYQYHILYSQIKDSIFNEKSSKQVAELQIRYETEKKEKEIEIQSHKLSEQELIISRSRLLLILISIGSLLLLILVWVTFSRYKFKKESQVKSEMLSHQEVLTKAIIETQEKERKRIAQDLHDGVGHKLTILKFNFEKIIEGVRSISPDQKIIFEQTENILDETHKEVRTLSHSMMPKALQEMEFAGAVSDLADQTLANSKLKYSLKNDSPIGLLPTIQVCLYRVLQELLNNILKHAHASEIAIQIFKNKNTIIMMVEDNGIGIHDDNMENGIGLRNIAGRINALNGIFTIEPGPVKGTIATVRIPL